MQSLILNMLLVMLITGPVNAQNIKTTEIAENLYMLKGVGGNVALATGEQPFVIDNDLSFASKKLLAAIGELTPTPVAFVVNTHFHADHIGGNPAMKAQGAVIISQHNARQRMTRESISGLTGKTSPASSPEAWPIITFAEEMDLHINDKKIEVRHLRNAHTDGDVIIRFVGDDVIHAGDIFLNGYFPIVDYYSGGSLQGLIAANRALLAMAGPDSTIIPGHGELGRRADVEAFIALCETLRERLQADIRSGKSLEELLAANRFADLEADWGSNFMPGSKAYRLLFLGEKALSERQ